MVCRSICVALILSACAGKPAPAPVAAATEKPRAPGTMEERCAAAAQLRNDGYVALNALKLEAARKLYLKSLELDPDNRGALFQLDVIEALGSDRQVGSSSDNDALYSATHMSPCQKFEAQKTAAKKAKPMGPPQVVANGQIISFAKGNAHERDMLNLNDLRATTQTAFQQVLSCYRQGLGDNPSLRGELTANLLVEADGRVSSVLLEGNSVDEATVERCIEGAFSALQFPRRNHKAAALHVLVPIALQSAELDTDIKAARR